MMFLIKLFYSRVGLIGLLLLQVHLNFIGNWTVVQDSFAVDAPNGVLMVDELDKQYTGIISLFNLVYDSNKKTLKYDVTPDDVKSVDLSSEFGLTTLVIYDERVQEVLDKLRSFK